MVESIVGFIVDLFGGVTGMPFGKELIVFIISLMPILELRGGLIAAALLDLNPVTSYINSILEWMRKSKKFNKIAKWLDKKVEKNKDKIEKFGFWGLVLFVGIPLPGTGAWTGCLVAAVLEMDRKKSFFAAMIGILIASIIMMVLSFGLLKGIVG